MPPVRITLFLAAVIVSGCTSTVHISGGQNDSVVRLNERGQKTAGTVRLYNGEKLRALGLRLEGDSLSFMTRVPDTADDRLTGLSRNDVESARFLSRGTGALEGLGLGVGIGFAAGFAMGALAAHEDCQGFLDFNCGSPTSVGFGYAVLNGILGAVIGPIVGAIVGKRRNFVFEAQPTR